MQLKRKRSDSEISTASSLLSSPPSGAYSMSMDMDAQIRSPSLFSSRTRKRYRDNRPDEDTIHQNTLSLLFSAQQSQSQSQPPPPSERQPISPPRRAFQNLANEPVPARQKSLHSFWALPKARSASNDFSSASSTSSHTPSVFQAANCEDCDAPLSSDQDAMDLDMDIDMMTAGGGTENWGCAACGKQVCRGCAVSNLGDMRCCLGCAGRRMGHGR